MTPGPQTSLLAPQPAPHRRPSTAGSLPSSFPPFQLAPSLSSPQLTGPLALQSPSPPGPRAPQPPRAPHSTGRIGSSHNVGADSNPFLFEHHTPRSASCTFHVFAAGLMKLRKTPNPRQAVYTPRKKSPSPRVPPQRKREASSVGYSHETYPSRGLGGVRGGRQHLACIWPSCVWGWWDFWRASDRDVGMCEQSGAGRRPHET